VQFSTSGSPALLSNYYNQHNLQRARIILNGVNRVEITSRVSRWKNNESTVTAYAIYIYIYIYIERERKSKDRISLFVRNRDADNHESFASSTSDPPLHAFSPRRAHNNAFVRRSIRDTSIFTREQAISRYRHDFPLCYSDCGAVVAAIADDEFIEEFFPSRTSQSFDASSVPRPDSTRAEICRIRAFSAIRCLASTKRARCDIRDLARLALESKRERAANV